MIVSRPGTLLVGFVAAIVVFGCGDDHTRSGSPPDRSRTDGREAKVCTTIGCSSGASFLLRGLQQRLPDAEKLRLCVDGGCRTYSAAVDAAMVMSRATMRVGTVELSIGVLDRDGDVLARDSATVEVEQSQPNGLGCPPICFRAAVRFDPSSLQLEPR